MSRHYNIEECTLELTVAGGNLVQRSKYIWKGAISVIKQDEKNGSSKFRFK